MWSRRRCHGNANPGKTLHHYCEIYLWLGWWAAQCEQCKWRVDNSRCMYYVIRNVGARLWERYIVYSCGYIQMFLVEQLLSIHINLAWRATHPCYWYYAFILTIGRYMANRRWRKAVSTLSTSVLKDMNNVLNHYDVKLINSNPAWRS